VARNESESGDYNEMINDDVAEEKSKSNSEDYYLRFLKALPVLSYDKFGTFHETLLNISQRVDVRRKNLRQLAFKNGIKCDELLEICKYKDEEITCCEYFLPIYSEHGLCYAFNSRYYSTPDNEY
jgi:amiloride-sensitive sodium channel